MRPNYAQRVPTKELGQSSVYTKKDGSNKRHYPLK